MATLARYTGNDLDILPDGKRREIIGGVAYMSTSPSHMYNYAVVELMGRLWVWDQQTKLGRAYVNSGIVFGEEDGVIPDVLWYSHARFARFAGSDGRFRGPPELVIEVLSPGSDNARRDRVVKLATYDRWGVDEYWIVSLTDRQVDQYRRVDGRLALVQQFGRADSVTTPLLPGFACPVAALGV